MTVTLLFVCLFVCLSLWKLCKVNISENMAMCLAAYTLVRWPGTKVTMF